MTEDELTSKILKLVSDIAPEIDPTTLDRNEPIQRALDLDSYDFLNLLVAIRDELGVTIDESDYDKVSTFTDLVSFVRSRVAAAGRARS